MKARGGFEVDVKWADGILSEVMIIGEPDADLKVRYSESSKSISLGAEGIIRLTNSDFK
ncbi:MAG: hypothetical protein GY808_12255 [Gammaproteobacteria bacterium]|nr:hypothetical protein [Gammaproteobacteria bacterium]